MEVGEICDIKMEDFFTLVEEEQGIYEVKTPQGWVEIGDLKREQKLCFLLRTLSGISLGAGHDHLVETQNGWERVDNLDINSCLVNTVDGSDEIVACEYLGSRQTFDFEVLNSEHKYYANGIVSHNCGKTMTCKYLRKGCSERGLEYRIITMEDYRRAFSHGQVGSLFHLGSPTARGIIFFDDMDIMFEDRAKGNSHLTEFLTNLDGIEPNEGVAFVFTSNKTEGLDGAFIRPGRVDLVVVFDAPTKGLRRRFIKERFHPELLERLDVEDLVTRMETSEAEPNAAFPYTYAEMEEIRKLLSIEYINTGRIDVNETFGLFEKHRQEFNERISQFGFKKMSDEDEDDECYYDDDEGCPAVPCDPQPCAPPRGPGRRHR